MRVLIVKASALGDIVHALPVLDYLHQVSPGIEVDWIVEERFKEILTDNPLVSRLHTIDSRRWRRSLFSPATWREIMTLKENILERKYKMVFDIQGNFKSGIITRLSGCSRRYGFDRDGVRESINLHCTTNHVPLRKQDYHVTDRSLRVVSVPFGQDYCTKQLVVDISTGVEDDAAAEFLLATMSDGLVFLLHHGTTWHTKLWHESGWIELGKALLERFADATILLSWSGEQEHQTAQRIASGIGRQARVLPGFSLKGFAAILKKIDLMIGGDTGPVHIAAAVGAPTVSFYRATDGKRNGPRGDMHRILQSPLPCSICLKKECERDSDCRKSISVQALLDAAVDLLLIPGKPPGEMTKSA